MIDFTLGNNKISMLPVFASNLTFATLDDEFNTIDKDSIKFRPSQITKIRHQKYQNICMFLKIILNLVLKY